MVGVGAEPRDGRVHARCCCAGLHLALENGLALIPTLPTRCKATSSECLFDATVSRCNIVRYLDVPSA